MDNSRVNTAWDRDDLSSCVECPEWIRVQFHNPRFVHVGSSDCPGLIPLVHERHHLMITAHNQLGKILDVRSQTWVFSNTQVARILGVEEVAHFFVVYL